MNLATKRLLMLLMLWLLFGHLAATRLLSVQALDQGRSSTKITFNLDEASPYRVMAGTGNKSFKVVFTGVENSALKPDYKRLSPVIDRITSSMEAGNAIVEINTMQRCNVRDYSLGKNVYLELEFIDPAPQSKTLKAPKKPAVRPAIKQSLEESSSTAQELAEPESTKTAQEQEAPIKVEAAPNTPNNTFTLNQWLGSKRKLWLILAASILLLLILLFLIFRKKRQPIHFEVASAKESQAVEVEELENPMLGRMAKRLANQGWTAAEIAAELNITESTAKRFIDSPSQ